MKRPNLDRGIVYKTSRRAYIGNYVIAAIFFVFALLLISRLGLTFNLIPRTLDDLLSTYAILGLFGVVSFLIEEPVIERWLRHYIVTNNEIIKVEGLIRKKKIITSYQSVGDVRFTKGVFGRIFNYGNVTVKSFVEGGTIEMKGMSNPDELANIIQNKINILRKKWISSRSDQQE